MPVSSGLSRSDLCEGFRRIGLGPGHKVMVHSSLSSFGHVEGGAESVIRALMDAVGERGLLVFPTFNHFAPWREGDAGYYDPVETPTTNGLIPETFRKMPGIYRSLNPTHPFAAWGRDAERYTCRHHLTLSMGPDSPLGMLWREGGYCLLLGTDYHRNTFKHVVEMSTGAPCLGRRTVELPVHLPDGRRVKLRTWGWRARRCPIMEPNEHVETEMERRGLHVQGKVGQSTVTFYKLSDCFEVLSSFLANGHAGYPPCSACPNRPSTGPHAVESDWDDGKHQLKSDSPSLEIGPMAHRVPE